VTFYAFSCRSIELVERLFGEVLNIKNSVSSIKERENKSLADTALAQAQLFPLRTERAKLLRENNDLHLENIRQVEHHRNELQKFQKQIRDLSDEVLQFQMLYKATKDELQTKEQMVEKLRDVRQLNFPCFSIQDLIFVVSFPLFCCDLNVILLFHLFLFCSLLVLSLSFLYRLMMV
jgi:DNA gyrase/topoisomerase IV subunit A